MQNNLSLSIQQLDANGVTMSRRVETSSDTAPTVGEWRAGVSPTSGVATVISFAGLVTQIRQIMIKNTHASAKITVVWTPNGGASATIGVIGPGAILAMWDPNTNAANGISAVSVQGDVNNTTFEMFIGG